MSQKALAEILHLKYQTIQKWENGKAWPLLSRLPEIARALNTTEAYLLVGIHPSPDIEGLDPDTLHFARALQKLGPEKRAIWMTKVLEVQEESATRKADRTPEEAKKEAQAAIGTSSVTKRRKAP